MLSVILVRTLVTGQWCRAALSGLHNLGVNAALGKSGGHHRIRQMGGLRGELPIDIAAGSTGETVSQARPIRIVMHAFVDRDLAETVPRPLHLHRFAPASRSSCTA